MRDTSDNNFTTYEAYFIMSECGVCHGFFTLLMTRLWRGGYISSGNAGGGQTVENLTEDQSLAL